MMPRNAAIKSRPNPLMKKNNRGAVDPITWGIIGLIAIGGWAYVKVFEPGRNKKVADQIAIATEKANKEAEAAKALALELQKAIDAAKDANDKTSKTEQQMRANAHNFNGQGKALLLADPNPSQYNMVARGMCDSVDDALGMRSTPEQQAAWAQRVVPLLQHNAEVERQLADERIKSAALAASLAAGRASAQAAEARAAALATQNSSNVTTIVATTAKAEKLAISRSLKLKSRPSSIAPSPSRRSVKPRPRPTNFSCRRIPCQDQISTHAFRWLVRLPCPLPA